MNLRTALEKLGRVMARKPRRILAAAVFTTLMGLWGASRLGVETDIAKLLPEDNPAARSYTEIADGFSTTSVLAIVAEGDDRASVINAAEEFAAKLRKDPKTEKLVRSVRVKLDRDFIDRWGFMLQDEEELADTGRMLGSTRLVPLLGAVNDLMEEKLSDGDDEEVSGPDGEDEAAAMMARFGLFARDLRGALAETGRGRTVAAERLVDDFLIGDRYYFDPEGKILLMTASPTFDIGNRSSLVALMTEARRIADETVGAEFSFAGDVASEADEEEAISADLFYPSIISIILILVLFAFSFDSLRSILFAVLALVVGIVADLGFAAVAVSKLNMITSSFGALLIGLGIDFGIHIASRFDEIAGTGANTEDAMAETFGAVVLPVSVGALTTALAFYSLCLSGTLAFRQFGAIAGTGILTTLAASITVLPALLAAFPKKGRDPKGVRGARRVFSYRSVARLSAFSARAGVPVLILAVAGTIATAVLIGRNKYEFDMRRIGPQGTDAQNTETLIGERFGISTYQALAVAGSLEESRSLAERLEKAPLIRRVESLADYVPSDGEQERRLEAIGVIARQSDRIGAFDWNAESVAAFTGEIRRLEMNLIELGDLAAASLGEDSAPVRARTATIREIFGPEAGKSGEEVYGRLIETIGNLDPGASASVLAGIDEAFAAALDRRITALADVRRPMTENDVPADILDDFRSPAGDKYLVVAQPSRGLSGDEAVLRFSDGLAEADQGATGTLILGVQLSREMLKESRSSMVIVGVLVLLLVAISFRSVSATTIVAIPFAMGLVWMFGLYPFIGRFNIVNALSIPLIFGVGIDYAVHYVSALRDAEAASNGRIDLEAALGRTGKAVVLSALTTMIGFGSLAFAGRFKGIADLGATLLLGIGCCLVSTILVLPAIHSFYSHGRHGSRGGRGSAANIPEESVKEAI
ncbi:MAG: hypothetical protein A2413_19700 [Treponema sp. RIFOXYC1_FULL_61_9]|nr:MAG: hypothetical protein A2413_19700 [Treponema sp. RIFOXYC1_FULL_61_9]